MKKKNQKQTEVNDILLEPLEDRRLLFAVPDPDGIRTGSDRRDLKLSEKDRAASREYMEHKKTGRRYRAHFQIEMTCIDGNKRKIKLRAECANISNSGILLHISNPEMENAIEGAARISMKFRIPPGAMPEGSEMRVEMDAALIRIQKNQETGDLFCAFTFAETLDAYAKRRKDRNTLFIGSITLFFIIVFIMLMRTESIMYFRFNKVIYLYSIIAAVFLLSRYMFGAMYRAVPVDISFTPGVTIIVPCFNEEEWIQRTIVGCVNQDYPIDKLEVIVVDDYSTDASVKKIEEIIHRLTKENARFMEGGRVRYVVQERNRGKRDALARGAQLAKHELVVFVDSDSFLDPYAIRNLVQPFKDPKMGGVSGRTDVANTYTNALTKMQSVRYYIAFRIMKAAEAYFDAVTCLSGPLACYKKEIVLEHCDEWLNQKFLGQRATFGDDRAMTNFVLRHHRTSYQDSATCSTIVPNRYKVFLKQQMRWKRSWLRESIIAGSFIWKKEPFTVTFFYMGLVIPILSPGIVLYNFLYIPITHSIFPTTFLLGLFFMAFLMSCVQLLLRKSSTWAYGFLFVLFYECVLLWQMPVAIVTFWKSTWGTRMTPEDVAESKKKKQRKNRRRHQPVRKRPEAEVPRRVITDIPVEQKSEQTEQDLIAK